MNYNASQPTRGAWRRAITIYALVALIAVSFFIGMRVGYVRGYHAVAPVGADGQVLNIAQPPEYLSKDVDFNLYWRVWNTLKEGYLKRPVSDTKLFYGSLEGMVQSLGDPYTVFLDPETTSQFTSDLAGKFDGIGAEIGFRNDVLSVIAPLPDTPAERAGLKAEDQILKIDDTETVGMGVEQAVLRIRGERGTQVKLSIFRAGFETPRDFVITRDEIVVDSVRTEMRDDGIAVVHIFQFGENTASRFSQEVLNLLTKNPKGIIVDLRNNPGGFLDAAVAIAGEWVPKDQIVVVEQNKERTEFRSEGAARLADIPTVVLVNGGSASASEIVSGALQDYKIAKLVGTKTFGKGSVQDFQMFEDGSAVKYTIAEWLTPLGRQISKIGIAPDEVVEFTEEDAKAGRDPQLDRAVELLGK